ncbi:transposase-like protein [Paraburkholderia sp. JPY465]
MKKITQEANSSKAQTKSVLDELIQQGARQIIQQAVEVELATMLEQYSNVKSIDGRRAVVRNGYLPEREVVTAIGPVTVQVPKVRDRSGSGIRFNSTIVPPYVRKSARVSAALPWLYLRGISTGDMSEAMGIMLGGQVSGMSPNVVSRLKAQWADEHEQWNRRARFKAALHIGRHLECQAIMVPPFFLCGIHDSKHPIWRRQTERRQTQSDCTSGPHAHRTHQCAG